MPRSKSSAPKAAKPETEAEESNITKVLETALANMPADPKKLNRGAILKAMSDAVGNKMSQEVNTPLHATFAAPAVCSRLDSSFLEESAPFFDGVTGIRGRNSQQR